jgi:hypothetical protein
MKQCGFPIRGDSAEQEGYQMVDLWRGYYGTVKTVL